MSFRDWSVQKLEDTFSLNRKKQCTALEEWLSADVAISKPSKNQLEILRKEIEIYGEYWNEEELKMNFIANILNMINFRTPHYNIFYERSIQGIIDNWVLNGDVDMMIASGRYEPKAPYFCFHEYKKQRGGQNDPLGQLLSEMLVAQKLNDNNQPMYGAYIIGAIWRFVTLIGKDYCVSNNYSATKTDELEDIYKIMSILKTIIDKQINTPS